MARAIPHEDQTSDFGEWTDDGYDDANSDKEDGLVWGLEKEKIEGWLSNDQVQDIPCQDETYDEQYHRVESGDSGMSEDPDYMACGKRKERLDTWKAHQDGLRAGLAHLPCYADEVFLQRKDAKEGRCCGG